MPAVQNLYIYTNPADPNNPPPPLLGPVDGTMTANLYTIPATANTAGLVLHTVYNLTISAMNKTNPGTPATCNGVAPPSYVLLV